jgi:NitT/TauT family transport system ATP-binding protein
LRRRYETCISDCISTSESALSSPLIQIKAVDKIYSNGTIALQGLNLDVGQHEFISLLGPSGCGKSTALRLIANLMEPSAGTVQWVDATNPSSGQARDLSFVFQEPTLMPWARVADNVGLPLTIRGVPKSQSAQQVQAALEMVGLREFAHVFPRELSGGMKMRVSIARALVTNPRLLLMDEPFAALDEMTRAKLNDDVLRLWGESKFTVIFVTHSVYEAVYLSNRIVVMASRPGRVIDEICVDEPFPRTQAFRTTAGYNELCIRVSQSLQKAGEHHG